MILASNPRNPTGQVTKCVLLLLHNELVDDTDELTAYSAVCSLTSRL